MSPAALLDDNNLLSEILLRLPPQPSSLPRASLVSKRWLGLVSDPRFLRRFRIYHRRNPPLLGFFDRDLVFAPTLEPPNCAPLRRFSLQLDRDRHFRLLGCRHGLVLIFLAPTMRLPRGRSQRQLQSPTPSAALPFPRSSASQRPTQPTVPCFAVPEKSTSSLLTVVAPDKPAVLIGDSLYWFITGSSSSILEFDLGRQSLAVIPLPLPVNEFDMSGYSVMRADDEGLGFLFLSDFSAQLWKRKTNSSWVLARTVELDELLSLDPQKDHAVVLGIAEYNNVVLLWTSIGTFIIQLESLQFSKLLDTHPLTCDNAFESVYTAGNIMT
ncbi:hypothetical protein QYE76_019744 [Lolium multiflorum]|uniref:F-box domain-containing protein n=1 Tax=Lolium multiflorum TaxID=4521 RepID=A0AAD8R4L3_LOLMU|nr:hypothetical protein QYE76_019744 [Lolium multiflorum]